MPLIKSASKNALQKNIESEMDSHPGKKRRDQNLAIAYSVQRQNRKKKKMADGGMVDNKEMREDEERMMSRMEPASPMEQPPRRYDEMEADRQGPSLSDEERQHNNGKKAYARGGYVSPEDEMEDEHDSSLVASIMAKRDRRPQQDSDSDDDSQMYMADGGMVDLSRNADEDFNEEDQMSFDALRKENYSESDGLDMLDQPEDSNEHGHDLSDEDEHDMVDQIRRKIMAKRR